MDRRAGLRWLAAGVAGPLTVFGRGAGAQAQPTVPGASWPSHPITWVVPFTPGGSTDVVARVISAKLPASLGQPVVVDNRPGAAGAVGAAYVAKAKPDGHTLFGGTISTHAINASLYTRHPGQTRRAAGYGDRRQHAAGVGGVDADRDSTLGRAGSQIGRVSELTDN